MSDDALERLKKRNRPNVKNRDASLTPSSLDTPISGIQELKTTTTTQSQISSTLDNQIPENVDNLTTSNQDASSKAQSVKPKEQLQELLTKQSTLRLEAQISDEIQSLCRELGVCREVLIESMFEYIKANPKAQAKVIAVAKDKNNYRLKVANHRRAKSMMDKFG